MRRSLIHMIVIALLPLLSCNKLALEPKGFVALEQFYKNEAEALQGLTGVYNTLGDASFYGRDWFFAFNIQDDLGYYDRNYTTEELFINNFSYTNPRLNSLWKNLYGGANRASIFLENVERVAFKDNTLKEAYKGEAKFLRAYYYFILSSLWGDIPLRKEAITSVSQESQIGPTSKTEIFDFIIQEMEQAETMVYTADKFQSMGRINKSTVQGILARVYLKQAGYPINKGKPAFEKALYWAQQVEISGLHSLNPDYQAVFINLIADEYETTYRESIWEVEFKGNNVDGNQTAGYLGSYNGIYCNDGTNADTPGWCYGYLSCTLKMEDLYTMPADAIRKNWNVAAFRYNYTAATGVRAKTNWSAAQMVYRSAGKFRREHEKSTPKARDFTPINFPVLRYADVLLMIAEADNEYNGAPTAVGYAAINEVRKRAMPTVALISGMNYGTFQQLVRDERARELCFEGTRKMDLVRWGIYVETMTTGRRNMVNESRWHANKKYASFIADFTSQKHNLYPIPSSELSTNSKMKQNPLW
ncbi:RagB/SusD family nutrient uptake outer membrane protein [Pedobacter helvus]|uniref:RagB/SusD family nutrient uptake outer membrane protein n=1 Tax=Pedobacter helvus TaxID=2563444 RepID=A0ABW9JR77_9SPHI|nr:RagB/SusD family nutrient uptake outer membrane protein [Pedobacter ureilyticus]